MKKVDFLNFKLKIYKKKRIFIFYNNEDFNFDFIFQYV